MRSILFVLSSTFLSPLVSAQDDVLSAGTREYLRDLDQRLAGHVEADGVGGLSLAVVLGDDIVWSTAHGLADPEQGIRATPETIYRTGSISKSITALLLAWMVDTGQVELDDVAADLCPDVRLLDGTDEAIEGMTLRHLASHTAGLAREPELEGAARGPIESWRQQILASLPTTGFDTLPGERYSYSNIGYGLLGHVLATTAERSFMEMVTESICARAGMSSSFFVIPDTLRERVAVGTYNPGERIDREAPAREHRGRGYKVPNGGVYASAPDLCRLIAALTRRDGSLLGDSWAEVRKVQTPESPVRGYGLGFTVEIDDEGRRMLSHGGSVAGYSAYWAFDPDARVGAAILRNYNRGETPLNGVEAVVREVRSGEREKD